MGRHRFALMSPDNLIYFIPYLGQSTKREGNVNNVIIISAINSAETYAHAKKLYKNYVFVVWK